MKLIGNLLMTVTLLVGLLAAATSYLAPIRMADASWQVGTDDDGNPNYLQTKNAAGATRTSDAEIATLRARYERGGITAQDMLAESEALHPVVGADEPLSPEALATIRANTLEVDGKTRRVGYVNIKEFSLMGWPYNWVFGLCVVGLFTGSMLVRSAAKAEIAAHAGAEQGSHHDSPDGLLAQTRLEIDRLRADLEKCTTEKQRTHLIVDRVGALQKKQLPDFVDARPMLIARLGLGGYAEMMGRFAAAERQINRAWSIAADGYYDEAGASLENAAHLLVETQEKMGV
jgi:hypothetical protein